MAQYSISNSSALISKVVDIYLFTAMCIAVFLSFLGVFVVVFFCAKEDKSNSLHLNFTHFVNFLMYESIFNFGKQLSCKETQFLLENTNKIINGRDLFWIKQRDIVNSISKYIFFLTMRTEFNLNQRTSFNGRVAVIK